MGTFQGTPYNVGNLNFQNVQNQTLPEEGPKSIPLLLDFTGSVTEWDVDLLQAEDQKKITSVQTLFIDMTGASGTMTVTIQGTNQLIVALKNTQGYYPVLCPYPTRLAFVSSSAHIIVPVQLINIPIAGVVWASA
jgi:hypothetical protein